MNILEYHLPPHCYSSRKREAEALAIHYFSCIYADPDRWDDPERCWELFHDLNLERDKELYGPWDIDLGNGHKDYIYASADWFVTGAGDVIELVPYGHKTWHAGASSYKGRENCNNFMAGVEIIAAPQVSAEYGFTEGHYRGVAEIILEYGFGDRVTTHQKIREEYQNKHPEKNIPDKKDPGPTWDWNRLNEYLNIRI